MKEKDKDSLKDILEERKKLFHGLRESMSELQRRSDAIVADLRERAPESMAIWLEQTIIFENMFGIGLGYCGMFHAQYPSEFLEEWGFESLEQCVKAFEELKVQWADQVHIEINLNEKESRVEIAVTPVGVTDLWINLNIIHGQLRDGSEKICV